AHHFSAAGITATWHNITINMDGDGVVYPGANVFRQNFRAKDVLRECVGIIDPMGAVCREKALTLLDVSNTWINYRCPINADFLHCLLELIDFVLIMLHQNKARFDLQTRL